MATANETEDQFVPTGDAAAASAAIDAWLREHAGTPAPNWHAVLSQIRIALIKLCQTDAIRADDRAQQIILRMVTAQDMDEFAADIDRLAERVAELTGRTIGRRHMASVLNGARSDVQRKTDGDAELSMPRMVLKL